MTRAEGLSNADAFSVTAEYLDRIFRRFAVVYLSGLGSEEMGMTSQLVDSGLEGVARSGGLFKEQHKECLGSQQLVVGDVGLSFLFQAEGDIEELFQLFHGPVLGGEKVLFGK